MRPEALLLICFFLVAAQLQAREADPQLSLSLTDADSGEAIEGMQVVLFHFSETRSTWRLVDSQVSNQQGKIEGFLAGDDHQGVYRLVLRNQKIFQQRNQKARYPLIPVVISIDNSEPVSLSVSISETTYSVSQTEP